MLGRARVVLGLAVVLAAVLLYGANEPREPGPAMVAIHVLTWATDGEMHDDVPDATGAFLLNPNRWPLSAMPVRVWLNLEGAPPGLPVEGMVRGAVDQWSNVPGSAFAYRFEGTTTARAGSCDRLNPEFDGRNTVTFSDGLSPGTLGVTCTRWTGGPSGNLVEFDIELNASIAWGATDSLGPGQFDLASTILHELGHGIGLGHPCSGGASCTADERVSVMYPALKAREIRNLLTVDDRAAVIEAYPSPGAQLPGTTLFVAGLARD